MKSSQMPNYDIRRTSCGKQPKPVRRNLPLPLIIFFDVVLLGVGLVVFALFHHVLPRDVKTSGLVLPTAVVTTSTTPTTSASAIITETNPTGSGETIVSPSTAASANGTWGAKFADQFTSGAVEKTDSSYKSANINITVKKVQANNVTYYLADIYLADLKYFRTAFAGGHYAHGASDEVLDMARENSALLAISGDYYGIRDEGIVIRNGELYREKLLDDVLVMNNDGSMQTFTSDEFDMNQIKKNGAWQAWSFGPMLLCDGKPMTEFNSRVTPKNPRAAIGYYEPGHYCFVLVDGRQEGYSVGMTLKELSSLFYDLGCKEAYNLDGGQSAVMSFMDQMTNQPYHGGRKVSDIIYIGE